MSRTGKREREREELARLYDELGPDLYRYAMVIVKNPSEAEDAVQQVFATLLVKWPQAESIERYLFSSVRNECRGTVERWNRFPPALEEFELEALPGTPDRPDERMLVERALATLPWEQREVIYLKNFTGRTLEEVAGVTGEPINTVWARYRYGMRRIREFVEGQTDDSQ